MGNFEINEKTTTGGGVLETSKNRKGKGPLNMALPKKQRTKRQLDLAPARDREKTHSRSEGGLKKEAKMKQGGENGLFDQGEIGPGNETQNETEKRAIEEDRYKLVDAA